MDARYWIVLLASGCADLAGIGDPKPLQPDATEVPCVVGGLDLCLFARPQNALDIDVDLSVDTTRDCNLVVYAPPAPSVCVIYANDIKISATVTAYGSRTLVLAASNSIDLSGTVDVSAYRMLGNYPAGADDPSCTQTMPSGYGGRAGGSFAGKGGNGGNGVGTPGPNNGGIAGPAIPRPEHVRGGCSGGSHSGGGVWLAAGAEIRVGATGRVLANGAGGRGNGNFGFSGGGGSGGMIRIAAPHLVLAGTITANGGGGAEGTDGNTDGGDGADGTIGTTRAGGGGGKCSVCGDGGAGAAGSALDGLNANSSTGTGPTIGGNGGGGAGFVHLASDAIENAAIISPPPST